MSKYAAFSIALAAALGVFSANKASADLILTGSYCAGNNPCTPGKVTAPGTYQQIAPDDPAGEANLQVALNPIASITASASGYANAQATIIYQFQVVGPASQAIPLGLLANASLASTFGGLGGIYLNVGGPNVAISDEIYHENGSIYSLSGTGATPGFDPAAFTLTHSFSVVANSLYDLQIYAQAGSGAATGYAFIDPFLFFDPSFQLANQYTIQVTPGVGNANPAVPEPSTWAMMILGFAGLGYLACRRRGQVNGLSAS
jgi:hypothetical protein